jgi:hypothetical protein
MPAGGIVTSDINNNTSGRVWQIGLATGLDTSGITPGTEVYLAAGGTFTATKPTTVGARRQFLGTVLEQHSTTGSIFVYPEPSFEVVAATAKPDIPISLGSYLVLTNIGASFDTVNALQRGLGIVEMDMTGYDSVRFTVRVNKVGTGTQEWQLWNETDASQVALISDSAAAGDNKLLTTTVTGVALTGIKTLRVRARSTVAADDPVFYGASILLRDTA